MLPQWAFPREGIDDAEHELCPDGVALAAGGGSPHIKVQRGLASPRETGRARFATRRPGQGAVLKRNPEWTQRFRNSEHSLLALPSAERGEAGHTPLAPRGPSPVTRRHLLPSPGLDRAIPARQRWRARSALLRRLGQAFFQILRIHDWGQRHGRPHPHEEGLHRGGICEASCMLNTISIERFPSSAKKYGLRA